MGALLVRWGKMTLPFQKAGAMNPFSLRSTIKKGKA